MIARFAVLFALIGTSAVADDSPGQPKSSDQKSLQGEWQLVEGERDGRAFPPEVAKGVQVVFSEDSMTTRSQGRETTFKFSLLEDQSPAGLDLDLDGAVGKGIYQLDGDTLTIVHGEADAERPTEFMANKGSGLTRLVLRRLLPSTAANYATTEIAFESHDGHAMFGKLTLPSTAAPNAVVIYVQTAEGATVDQKRRKGKDATFNYYDLYREKLPAMNVGFFSYEGRGIRMGDKPPRFETIDWEAYETSTLENKVRDALSAIDVVRDRPGLEMTPIWLIGASESTLLAAETAARAPQAVAGLVLYGVLATNLRENFKYIMSDGAHLAYRGYFDANADGRITSEEFEADAKKYREKVLRNAPFSAIDRDGDGEFSVADMRSLTKVYLDAVDADDFKVLQAWAKANAAVVVPSRWFEDHFAHRPVWDFLQSLEIPIGCFHGALDTNAPIAAVKALEEKARAAGKDKMEFFYFDDLDHSLNVGEYFVSGELPAGHAAIFKFLERHTRVENAAP